MVGFSGSRTDEHVSAFFYGFKASGAAMARPVLLKTGQGAYTAGGVGRWGDYSATTMNPNLSDEAFWTVQEYGGWDLDPGFETGAWATWISQIRSR